jgi:hypothetical protein
VISQFDGPMIKVGDGCRAIKTLEMAQKTGLAEGSLATDLPQGTNRAAAPALTY